jgi:hypothetical protein
MLLGFLVAGILQPAAAQPRLELPEPKGPAMWRLQADDARVYLLGSFHLLPPSVDWHDTRVETAMAEADAVAFEIDLREMEKPEVAASIMKRATLPDGQVLKDKLSPETYAHLQRVAADLPINMSTLEKAKPWFAATGLVMAYSMSRGADPAMGVDSVLTREAAAAGKDIRTFETIDQQFDLLETMSQEDPDFLMMDAIRLFEDDHDLLDRTVSAWMSGDSQVLDGLMREDLGPFAGAYERFIVDRNTAWVPQIEAMIREGGTYLVVVGAGHLVGDQGVVALLRERGHHLERY